ncbi:hypothetical protein TNCV_2501 [Trichonephila clavipes]|nr:hypothetical protein TNCV_2501 [Trichonephila clavipes]
MRIEQNTCDKKVGRLQEASAVTARKSGGNYSNRRENVFKVLLLWYSKDTDRRNVGRDRGTNALPVTSPGEMPQASILLQVAPGQEGGMYISGNLLRDNYAVPKHSTPVVYKQRNFGSVSHPTEKGDAFPTPGRRQCTHKYIMVWDVFWEFPAFWVSYGPREDIPPLTSDQSEKLIVFLEK